MQFTIVDVGWEIQEKVVFCFLSLSFGGNLKVKY